MTDNDQLVYRRQKQGTILEYRYRLICRVLRLSQWLSRVTS